ncbi:MAG: PAS domain-containing protein [Solirubrobacterales bacterium]
MGFQNEKEYRNEQAQPSDGKQVPGNTRNNHLAFSRIGMYRGETVQDYIVNNIAEGFVVLQVVLDENGRPDDYNILEVNTAFIEHAGVPGKKIAGRRAKDILPALDPIWFQRTEKLLKTGGSLRFEYHHPLTGRWYDVKFCSLHKEDQFIAIFTDITRRKQAAIEKVEYLNEIKLLESINTIYRLAPDCGSEEEIGRICLEQALRITGTHVGFLGVINDEGLVDDLAVIDSPGNQFNRSGVPKGIPIAGLHKRVLYEGKTVMTNDPTAHPDSIGTPDNHLEIRSFLAVPMTDKGKVFGIVAVANRDAGFSANNQHALELMSKTFVQVLMRWRAEEGLRQAQAQSEQDKRRLETILETIPSSVIIVEASDRKFSFINRRGMELYGIDYVGMEVDTHIENVKPLRIDGSVYPPEELPVNCCLTWGKAVYNKELIMQRSNGERLPLMVSAAPLLNAQGNVTAAVVSFDDITERLQAENILRENKARLAEQVQERTRELQRANQRTNDILGSIKDPFFAVDGEWRFTYANSAALERYGSGDDVLGKNIWIRYPGFFGSEFWNKCHEVMREKQPICFESRSRRREQWSEVRLYPFGDGISVLFNDITEKKQVEEEVRSSRELLYSSVENMLDCFAILSSVRNDAGGIADFHVDYVNHAACESIGIPPEALFGKRYFELFPERRMMGFFHEACAMVETGEPLIKAAYSNMDDPNPALRGIYDIRCVKLNDGFITTWRNITDLRRMEMELARLDRLNLIGEMAASIGHEIRNPMTTVRGFLQMLHQKECYTGDKAYFELMIEELDRANGIITEYLGLARDKDIQLKPTDLNLVIQEIAPMIQADANAKEITLELVLNELPVLFMDKSEIRQLLINLARNGMEAMQPGGILTIGTSTDGREPILFVKDQGRGIAPNIIEKLGTPFLTTKENGTGLGLAVCYSIAVRHKARLEVETGPVGTTFMLAFSGSGEECHNQ